MTDRLRKPPRRSNFYFPIRLNARLKQYLSIRKAGDLARAGFFQQRISSILRVSE
jgi:hypothetical protein